MLAKRKQTEKSEMNPKNPELIIDDILKYVPRFQGETFVIYFSGQLFEKIELAGLIRQIAILHSLSVKIIIVHGSRPQISNLAENLKISSARKKGLRVTNDKLMKIVKEASLDISYKIIETLSNKALTGLKIYPVLGNFVKAKCLGVIDGIDFGLTGVVEKVNKKILNNLLELKYIPVISPLGLDAMGNLFNVRSIEVATRVAIDMNAIKILFVLEEDLTWTVAEGSKSGEIQASGAFGDINTRDFPAIIKELKDKKKLTELQEERLLSGFSACEGGVERVHFIDGREKNALLGEVFTQTGKGLLISQYSYSQIRQAQKNDAHLILDLLKNSNELGEFLPRNENDFLTMIHDFRVFEIDGKICSSGALHLYQEQMVAEIAALVVDSGYRGHGIGKKMVSFLLEISKKKGIKKVVVCTTRAEQFFKEMGFTENRDKNIPDEIKKRGKDPRKPKILIKNIK